MARYIEERYGNCPVCGQTDGYLNISCNHWFVCHEHKTKWFVGSSLFSSWQIETEVDWLGNAVLLGRYKDVEPVAGKGQIPVTTVQEELSYHDLQNTLDRRRILIIDDEPTVRQSCERIFAERGYEVETAASAKEGLARALRGYFDCALIDLKLPDMDGMEIVRNARAKRGNMAVLVITGYGTAETAAEATRLGVSAYIYKPFTPQELVTAVENAVQDEGKENSQLGRMRSHLPPPGKEK